ncbi:putative transporter slc-17.2 [Blattella germanica]|nr:putative transporter slc-17.2 [Blattella germanica]
MFNLILLRFNLSFALVCMVREDNSSGWVDNSTESDCPIPATSNTSRGNAVVGEFEWNKMLQGRILSAFFYGYIVIQGVGGWFSDRFGGKLFFIMGNLLQSIITLLLPAASRFHPEALFGLRVVQGIGLSLPSLFQLYTHWASPTERTALVGIAYMGFPIANVIIFPLSGVLCEYGFDGGWPSIFYVTGLFGLSCSIAFFFLVYDNPDKHPRISEEERRYLNSCTHSTSSKNGFLSALPYIGMLAMRIIISSSFAPLQKWSGFSLSRLRKINHTIGTVGAGLCMLVITALTCRDQYVAVAFITLGQAISDLAFTGGYLLSYLDLAPQYAGLLTGISNTIGSFAGGTREEWMIVMYITTAFYFLGAIVYLFFGTSELQSWARLPQDDVTLQEINNSLLKHK